MKVHIAFPLYSFRFMLNLVFVLCCNFSVAFRTLAVPGPCGVLLKGFVFCNGCFPMRGTIAKATACYSLLAC